MKIKKFIPYIFLTIITIALAILIVPKNHLFGSNTDWLSQHIVLSDYLREAMLKNKSMFLDFALELGAGQNIYNISYYGLFRFDVLIGCLFKNILMKDIVIGYLFFNLIMSVNLMFYWLKSKKLDLWLCIIGAVLLLCSSLLFQSHRQIMFVDYMVWLILGLISVDRYLKNNNSLFVVISVIGIIINSYFFSISAILVLFSYFCFEVIKERKITVKEILYFLLPIITAILICSVLLLPSAYVMIENHQSGKGSLDLVSLLIPSFNFDALLYDPYGCGLTYLSWVGLMLSLKLKETRKLSIYLLIIIFIPIFRFGLNGFLYPRAKILIPFIPLIIYVVVTTLKQYKQLNIKIDYLIALFLILPIFFFINKPLIVIDIISCLIVISLYLKFNQQLISLLIIPPLIISYITNQKESYVENKTYQQVTALKKYQGDSNYRFDYFDHALDSVNLVNNNLRSSLYSSISNRLYSQFYYDVIKNPISIKNRVACLSNSNIFFQGLLGVKTIYSQNTVPIGYQKIAENLYQNNHVLPLVYATSDTYSKKAFDKLTFPNTLDTIYNNVIVENNNHDYQSKIVTSYLDPTIIDQSSNLNIKKINNGYRINTNKTGNLILNLNKALYNQILIIEFDLQKVKHIKTLDTSITINGIKNKLSSLKAAYPNNNNHFTYIISQNESLKQLDIQFSHGQYDLKNIKTYTLDYDVIKNRNEQIIPLNGQINQKDALVKGEIEVLEDSYLVTSFPYQHGFTIFIDGQKVKTECVNTAFLGAKIKEGKHTVEIKFKAPMKDIGLILSSLGIVLLIIQGVKKSEQKSKRIN